MAGRTPAPTALKLLKGVRPARINRAEPKPQSASGELPAAWAPQMSAQARVFWKHYAPMLSRLGVLTEADLPALWVLAELWAKWLDCGRRLKKRNVKPEIELSYLRFADKLESQLLRYLQHFGMTASSRGKITMTGSDGREDPDYLD